MFEHRFSDNPFVRRHRFQNVDEEGAQTRYGGMIISLPNTASWLTLSQIGCVVLSTIVPLCVAIALESTCQYKFDRVRRALPHHRVEATSQQSFQGTTASGPTPVDYGCHLSFRDRVSNGSRIVFEDIP